jgi:uncharacterized protein YkwD
MFLQAASVPLSLTLFDRFPLLQQASDFERFAELRQNLLEMVNEERAVERVPLVKLDDLATRVATNHALEMATHQFASHWGLDGLKPYHRYSFAGGTEATQENVSAADNTWSTKLSDLKQDTSYLHLRLYQEKPPNDGHRRTILAPQHTHVGFGIAVEKLRLRLVELFIARYVEVKPIVREAKTGSVVLFAGRILRRDHTLNGVEVFYEPLPTRPELSWLQQPRSYGLPEESKPLRPKVTPPYTYTDRTRGEIDLDSSGNFSVPITLAHDKPGIYTLMMWLQPRSGRAFPATGVCVQSADR